jgi:hypothetical protein
VAEPIGGLVDGRIGVPIGLELAPQIAAASCDQTCDRCGAPVGVLPSAQIDAAVAARPLHVRAAIRYEVIQNGVRQSAVTQFVALAFEVVANALPYAATLYGAYRLLLFHARVENRRDRDLPHDCQF